MTLDQAAELLGMSEDALVELVTEAEVASRGGVSGEWLFEATDLLAVVAERERREQLNRMELAKLSASLEDADE